MRCRRVASRCSSSTLRFRGPSTCCVRAAGISTADPQLADIDVADGLVDLSALERVRRTVLVGMAIALAAAFAPIVLPLVLLVAVVLALGTARWHGDRGSPRCGSSSPALRRRSAAALLNLPWILSWSWEGLVGAAPIGEAGLGLRSVASFEIGVTDFAALSLALYVPVFAALLLARAWRLTWAVRARLLVVVFEALAVLGDRGQLPIAPPQAGVLLVPLHSAPRSRRRRRWPRSTSMFAVVRSAGSSRSASSRAWRWSSASFPA